MRSLLVVVATAIAAFSLSAAPVHLVLDMTTGQEIPMPTLTPESNPMGVADLMFDLDAGTLSAMLTWQDMTSAVRAAHIHRINPAAAIPGTGGVVVGFFAGQDFSITGSYTTATPIALTADQVNTLRAGFAAGDLYVNVHTATNPAGEIRANLGEVPEPASTLLFLSGCAGLALIGRRRLRL